MANNTLFEGDNKKGNSQLRVISIIFGGVLALDFYASLPIPQCCSSANESIQKNVLLLMQYSVQVALNRGQTKDSLFCVLLSIVLTALLTQAKN